jgi:ubiquinone/menaquinone biosynthesis C-methylase UbiE
MAQVQPGMRVVDVGCGRGEIVFHSALRGAQAWGIDYAPEALTLANETFADRAAQETVGSFHFVNSDSRHLPFPTETVDLVFMLDVVEHLTPHELQQALSEAHRILCAGGKMIIHTMPNLWYYRLGYPIYRALQRLRGHRLPADPRDRWAYKHVHVNEQTPLSLSRSLRKSGFETRVWLRTTQTYDYEPNIWVRRGMALLTQAYPLKLIFCNDIFAEGTKP